MRRRMIGLVLVLISCLGLMSGPVSARSSAGTALITHEWTYFAIEDLVRDRDIPQMSVPDELNRNQGALLLARLLQYLSGDEHLESRRFGLAKNVYLDDMIFTYNQRVASDKALTEAQVELLYRLVLEFHRELEILGYAIQDFDLLAADNLLRKAGGVFVRQPLLYSEQALAAARKADETARLESEGASQRKAEKDVGGASASEPPKNLWTGQYSGAKYLPPTSSIVVREKEEPEENHQMFQLGGIEVSGGLRAGFTAPHSDDEEGTAEGGAGYGISVKMGELALTTAVDLAVESFVPKSASTSVDLSLDWADLFTLSAGIRQKGLLSGETNEDGEDLLPVVTSLGLMVPIKRGQLHLGMTQEWGKSHRGEGPGVDEEEPGLNTGLPKNIAELGLTYDFDGDSSLRFNYSLIDFSNVGQGDAHTKAEAKFSIKF